MMAQMTEMIETRRGTGRRAPGNLSNSTWDEEGAGLRLKPDAGVKSMGQENCCCRAQQQPQSINRRHLPSSQTGRRRVMGNVVVTVRSLQDNSPQSSAVYSDRQTQQYTDHPGPSLVCSMDLGQTM
ncbi:hypothetical protein INR49_028168 [Caranx melampygus]|nr:hypothetical protein INR49_028168 [Caranx melampygus]